MTLIEDSTQDLIMRATGFTPEDFEMTGIESNTPEKVSSLHCKITGWFTFAVTSSKENHAAYIVTTDNEWKLTTGCMCDWCIKGHHETCKHQKRIQIVLDKREKRLEREWVDNYKARMQKELAEKSVEDKMMNAPLTRQAGFKILK